MGYVISFVVGLLVGGAVVYIYYTKIASKVGQVTLAAEAIKKA